MRVQTIIGKKLKQLLEVVGKTWMLILDTGCRILHHWIAPPGFSLGCR
jgi:hypothetical protein